MSSIFSKKVLPIFIQRICGKNPRRRRGNQQPSGLLVSARFLGL